MRIRTAAIAAALLLATITACSGSSADPDACKADLLQQPKEPTETVKEGKRPAACEGLDDKTVERLTGEATTEWLETLSDSYDERSIGLEEELADRREELTDLQEDMDRLGKGLDGVTTSP
ncbi:hypothetical protein ACH492_32110 [Streptomyces sp. NPDC019443]|uniref:hypothetical protein n=1 Tax=Streptomyces sp. NPDC019443 TaxID=3365061 RepID=UPI00378F2596